MEGAASSARRWAASRSTTWRLVVFSLFVALAALPDFLTLSLLPNARVRFIEHIFPSCETPTANTCTQTTVLYFASLDTVFGLVSVWLAPKVGAYTDTNGRRGVLLAFAGVNFLSAVSLAMLVHRLEAEEESSSPYFFRFLFFLYSGCVSLFNSVGAVYGFFGMAPVQATLVDLSTTEDRLGREEASDGLLPVSSSTTSRFNGSGGASNLDLEDVNDEVLVLRPARRVVLTEGEHSMMPDVFRKLPSTTACCTAPPPASSGGRVGVLAGEGESAPQADEELLPNVEDGFDTAEEAEEVLEVSKMATGGSFHTADDSSCQGSSSSSSQSAEGARPSFTHKSTGFGGAAGYESFARVEQREPRASAGDKENISCEDEDEDIDYEAANSTLFEHVGIAAKADDDAARAPAAGRGHPSNGEGPPDEGHVRADTQTEGPAALRDTPLAASTSSDLPPLLDADTTATSASAGGQRPRPASSASSASRPRRAGGGNNEDYQRGNMGTISDDDRLTRNFNGFFVLLTVCICVGPAVGVFVEKRFGGLAAVFDLNVLLACTALVLAYRVLPRDGPDSARGRRLRAAQNRRAALREVLQGVDEEDADEASSPGEDDDAGAKIMGGALLDGVFESNETSNARISSRNFATARTSDSSTRSSRTSSLSGAGDRDVSFTSESSSSRQQPSFVEILDEDWQYEDEGATSTVVRGGRRANHNPQHGGRQEVVTGTVLVRGEPRSETAADGDFHLRRDSEAVARTARLYCITTRMLRAISPSAITFPKAIRYAAYIRCILSFSSQGIQEQVLYYLQQVANLQPRDTATLFFAVGLSGALVSGGLAVVSSRRPATPTATAATAPASTSSDLASSTTRIRVVRIGLFLNFVHMVILCLLYYLPSFALALTAEIAVGVSFPAVACLSSIVGKAAPRDQIGRAQGFVQSFAQLGRIFGPVAFAGVYAVGSAVALPAYLPYALGAMCSLAAFGVALKMPAE